MAEIPGFYYDEARGRYFKITNTGQAVAQGMGSYSKSNVAMKQRENEEMCQKLINEEYDRGKVHKLSLRNLLFKEKLDNYQQDNMRKNLSIQLIGKEKSSSTQNWMIDGGYGADNIECMGYDNVKDEIILGLRSGRGYGFNRAREEYRMIRPFTSRVTSIDISGRMLLMTSFGKSNNGGRVNLSEITDEEEEDIEARRAGIYAQNNLIEFFGDKKDTLWSSRLLDGGGRVIVGGRNKVNVWQDLRGPVWSENFHTGSDCLAVDGLDNDRIIGVGCRNGKVKLFDCREQPQQNNARSEVQNVKHGSTVTNIKRLKDGRSVLVSGLEDNLACYDLRFITNNDLKRTSQGEKKRSKEVFKYYGYENRIDINHGFDITSDDRYLAVGSKRNVNIYEIHTGKILNQLESGTANCIAWDQANCIYVGQKDRFIRYRI